MRPQRRSRTQRGLTQSTQFAIIFPLLMLVTLGIIQAGIWVHGHNVAIRAANAAADTTRGTYGTAVDGKEIAHDLASQGGLTRVTTDITKGPTEVLVTLTATIPMFFGFGLGSITETSSMPVERTTR